MYYKKLCAGALYFTILATLLFNTIQPVYASESEAVPLVCENSDLNQSTEPSEADGELAAVRKVLPTAGSRTDDLNTVSGKVISFRLFNYSNAINKTQVKKEWRPISKFFTFRNSKMTTGTDPATVDIPNPNTNSDHDQDGFVKQHATVERILVDGYPVLDLTRNADGSARTDPQVAENVRSLRYLFSAGDHAVTAYSPANTILQQNGSHYWYNSADHAVDYDTAENRFRLRSYVERNNLTANYGSVYGDFLPFTYTGGSVLGSSEDGTAYHVSTQDTDYWFGMTMQVDFIQAKDGKLGSEDMIFSFSGDDDVWVFVDDVLVLDLGGTHGTVTGTVNFATGEIQQYLTWADANKTEEERIHGSDTSFPTTIRACFDAAGRLPNGGWSAEGQTFADFTEHTLKFFYLERGASVANCSLDFRLPTLPDESLTVTKDLIAADGTQPESDFAGSLEYCFRVLKVNEMGESTDRPFIQSGMTYDLLENGLKIGTGTVDENHCFYLKAGQSAQFTQMLHKGGGATGYIVEERIPYEQLEQYAEVRYLIGGVDAAATAVDDPQMRVTAFQTCKISAGETQSITFQNKVDTTKLGSLRITKLAAPGTQIPTNIFFQIQVKTGETLLPSGTVYMVGQEQRIVENSGILLLRVNETAVIPNAFLAETQYSITELSASLDGYRPEYRGAVKPYGEITCTKDGVNGVLPLAGAADITIINADYDFAIQIPVKKRVIDFQHKDSFSFLIEQVERQEDQWNVVAILPEVVITVPGSDTAEQVVTIGYPFNTEGTFYYRITEKGGKENYIQDTGIFLVEVTVSDDKAEIVQIQKDEEAVQEICFVNRVVTTLTVTKTISGGSGSKKFPFTAEVFLSGEAFDLPASGSNDHYTLQKNVIRFSLGHGESITLPNIPIGATVVIEEHEYDGFLVLSELEGVDTTQISGAYREIQFADKPQTIHFTNQTGFRLPNTGGTGSGMYTAAGLFLVCTGMCLQYLYANRERKRRKLINNETELNTKGI